MTSIRIAGPGMDEAQPAPSAGHTVTAGGLRLHYLDYGTAGRTPMLCMHGGAAHAHWYDFVAAAFSADYHVRALDQRGHGDSEWSDPPEYTTGRLTSDLAEVVEKLGLRDFVLVGHSMGGMISLTYAATHPGRVGLLVIVDSTLRLSEDRAAAMREQSKRQSSYATREELVARYRLVPGDSTATPGIVRHVAQNAGRRDADGKWRHKFDRNIYAQRGSVNGMPCFARLRIPVLLVRGAQSTRLSPEVLADVKAHCPHVEFAEVAHSGHHVMLDNPGGFASAVKPFLARHA